MDARTGQALETMMSDFPDGDLLRTWAMKATWRAKASVRAEGLRASAKLSVVRNGVILGTDGNIEDAKAMEILRPVYDSVCERAADAAHYIRQRTGPLTWLNGSLVEATWANIHEGDTQLVGLLPDDQLIGRMPSTIRMIQTCLSSDDPRRTSLEKWWASHGDAPAPAVTTHRFPSPIRHLPTTCPIRAERSLMNIEN